MRNWSSETAKSRINIVFDVAITQQLMYNINGINHFIPFKAIVHKKRIIAGMGVEEKLRIANRLSKIYEGIRVNGRKLSELLNRGSLFLTYIGIAILKLEI